MRNESNENLWGMRVIAFIMALLLFTFVSYENSQRVQSTNPGDGASITGVEELEDVPININVDHERYYVSGIPESAQVQLRGPQSLILQTLATQNITVETPNLNDLGIGTHEIQLYIDNLSHQIEYRIDPLSVTVTIEERVSNSFNLSVAFNPEDVASGYQAGEPELSQTEVLVTGSASAIANIDTVQVVVPAGEEMYTDNINMSLPVVVTDSQGELMDVSVEPGEVNLFIPVERPAKTVPLTLEETGEMEEDYTYNISFAEDQEQEITIYGPGEILDQIQTWPIEVDLTGIEEDTEVEIPVEGYNGINETDLESVSVIIEVEENTANQNNTTRSLNRQQSENEEDEAEENTEGGNTDANEEGADTSDTSDEEATTEDTDTATVEELEESEVENDTTNEDEETNITE